VSAENVIAALLGVSALNAQFGSRRALVRLPGGTDQTQKCLVYAVITDEPTPNVNYADGKARARARVRVTVTAKTVQEVLDAHAAVRAAIDFTHGGTHGGHVVVSCRKAQSGPMQKDDSLGVWWRPDDYVLAYYE
jgi:hypothetical protein